MAFGGMDAPVATLGTYSARGVKILFFIYSPRNKTCSMHMYICNTRQEAALTVATERYKSTTLH